VLQHFFLIFCISSYGQRNTLKILRTLSLRTITETKTKTKTKTKNKNKKQQEGSSLISRIKLEN